MGTVGVGQRRFPRLALGDALLRNVMTVASGTAVSQAIAMAFTPLITRIYGPDAVGLHGVFTSVVLPLGAIGALGYPIATVLPKEDRDALGLVRLSLFVGAATTLIAFSCLYFFGSHLFAALNASAIGAFVFLVPLAMFFAVLSDTLRHWLIRKQAYGVIARYGALSTLLQNVIKAGFGFLYPSALVLVVTSTFGGLIGTALTYLGWRRKVSPDDEHVEQALDRHRLTTLAKQHSDFPLLRTPQNLINISSRSLPLLLLAGHFGPGAAGQYTIAMAVLAAPAMLIGGAVHAAFYPRINEAIVAGEKATGLILKSTAAMLIVGALPFLTVMVAGPVLFEIVFGGEWRTAGVYSQWLSLWLWFGFANRPAVSAIPSLRLQGFLLVHEIASVALRLAGLYMGFRLVGDPVWGIAGFSIVGALLNGWLIAYVIRASARKEAAE